MNKGYSSHILFALQGLIALLFASITIHILISMYLSGRIWNLDVSVTAFAYLVVIALSLLTHIMLKIKHRSHTPEGELLPMLFLFLTLESASILPIYFMETGILIIDTLLTNILIRFSILSSAIMFIFASLLYMGSNITQLGSFITTSLIASLILSVLAPSSSSIQSAQYGFGSNYDVYFTFATILLHLAAIATYIVAAITDKVGHNIRRSVTFIVMIIGNWGIFTQTGYEVTIISTILFIASSIMLILTSKDSF